MNVGKIIKTARMSKGLTQQELGDIVGVQKSAIAKYENGRVVNIKRSTLQKISSALDIRPSELVFEKTPELTANFHVQILTDFDLMETLRKYYELSPEKQKTARDFISFLSID